MSNDEYQQQDFWRHLPKGSGVEEAITKAGARVYKPLTEEDFRQFMEDLAKNMDEDEQF